jgi:hypothetical protein
MCGILGFSDRNPTTLAMMPALAIGMATRGRDSWGVTNGHEVHKEARCILDGYVDLELPGPQTFHTRGASVGAVTDDNAHPFTHTAPSGLKVTGVHNGHISNYGDLNTKYHRNFAVDSQHIFAHIAERRDLGEIDGWGTIVWWEHHPGEAAPRGPFFSGWRNMNLAVCKLSTGDVVWASTKQPIDVGARFAGVEITKTYSLEPKKKYMLARLPEGDWGLLTTKGVLAWAERPFVRSSPVRSDAATYGHGNSGWPSNICNTMRCHRPLKSKGDVVCPGCLREVQVKLGVLQNDVAAKDRWVGPTEWGVEYLQKRQTHDAY